MLTLPMPALYGIATAGTLLKKVTGFESPLTLFRLKNMMTEMRLDTTELESVFGALPNSNATGVKTTLDWLESN